MVTVAAAPLPAWLMGERWEDGVRWGGVVTGLARAWVFTARAGFWALPTPLPPVVDSIGVRAFGQWSK